MTKTCRQNPEHAFEVTEADMAFYDKMDVPPPTLCPTCRVQRRLVWRNERRLYNGKCAKCGSEIITVYRPGSSYHVYCKNCYYADDWDARNYGRDFDFSREFFPQFDELNRAVPQLALNVVSNENAEYVNLSGYNKNCYLLFAGEYDENVYYAENTIKSQSCLDTTHVTHSELVSNSVDAERCYNVHFSYKAKDCRDIYFLFDCIGCQESILCSNLRIAEYCIMNRKYPREEYMRHKETFLGQIGSTAGLAEMKRRFADLMASSVHRFATLVNAENASGDDLQDVKNAEACFRVNKGEDIKYVSDGFDVKDGMDVNNSTESEISYEGISVGYHTYDTRFCCGVWTSSSALYSAICKACQHIFGCSNMRNAEYCILNKPYSREEYGTVVTKVINHMRDTGEWGEFFPVNLTPFAYNETYAFQRLPLDRERALSLGFRWLDDEPTSAFHGTKNSVPETLAQATDDVTKEILVCETCGKNYKIIIQELKLYRQFGIVLPSSCYNCRHSERLKLQNPGILYDRACMKCSAPIRTTYAPNRKETVYCEKCYQQAVY